ncbi:MAG: bifunctional methylenetetrahydrofolate dehydrogenase/methenyltetrahydrofolate cyclohydrolase FolD [Clostridia bacterium]|nr:bifunctional methylenetetrahydrofolate dehydrogenase/methenyltetrahydrofolate cyclohydrolase FolD [Clostridia bacterium]
MRIIDGKEVSLYIKQKIKDEVSTMQTPPGLAVILVGDDPASHVYVNNKKKACEFCGFYSESYELAADTDEKSLLELIDTLNEKDTIHGILVQMPLPKHINADAVINRILPSKDVDAFSPVNVGKIMLGDFDFLPCTPAGVMELLKYYNIDVCGKNCVVLGRSNIVGKPMSMLLLHSNATVTVCHSKTRDLKEITKKADVLVSAIGRPLFVTEDMVKEDAVVIDVGINRNAEGKLCGDVDFENVSKKASYITPVPGGVGPMTIAMLMQNTLTAAKLVKEN